MDLQDYAYLDTVAKAVPHPRTGEATTWTWTLAGPSHPASLALAEAAWRRQVDRQAQRQRALAEAADAGTPAPALVDTLAQQRLDTAERLAGRVLGWSPVTVNGVDHPYSPEAVRALLADPRYGLIAAWAQMVLGEPVNFLPAPAAPSSATPDTNSGLGAGQTAGDANVTT